VPERAFPELEQSIAAVEEDVATALDDFGLIRGDGFRTQVVGRLDDRDMVQWEYDGVAGRDFLELGGDEVEVPVTVRGVTFVYLEPEESEQPFFVRYVDWIGVYGQLGMTISWRRPIPGAPDDVD
jgi:hypothetical protein